MELSSQPQIRAGTAVLASRISGECSDGSAAPAPNLARACGQTETLTCPCLCRRWQGPCRHEGLTASAASKCSSRKTRWLDFFSATSRLGQPTVRLPSPTPHNSSQLLQPSHMLSGRLWCSAGQYDAGACRVRWQPPACSQIVWGSLKS